MNVLIAVDLSHEPERVVDAASAWAVAFGAVADLAFVDPIPGLGLMARFQNLASPLAAEFRAMGELQKDALEKLLLRVPGQARGEAHVWEGNAAEEIAARAATYDLVLTGTHGRQGVEHLVLGSVAERIARASRTPVLVVRNAPGPEAPTVLAAVALGDEAMQIMHKAITYGVALKGTIDVAYIEDIVAMAPFTVEGSVQAIMTEQLVIRKKAATSALDSLLKLVPEVHRGKARMDVGVPGAEIARWGGGYDLVVTGTHGRAGLDRLWLGSVAEKVLRACPRSVLVLPLDPVEPAPAA